ncbi:MAG: VOC family protein [Xanthobacteraceae bacterium]
MDEKRYDRADEDLGNITNLGHVNVSIADQRLSTAYYVSALGLTRDPYLNTGTDNMWINVGMSQFHMPTGEPQVLRGVTGLVIPDREALLARLAKARKELSGTRFAFRESNDCVETTCPWGNHINCHAPDREGFGAIVLGMPYISWDVGPGTAPGIASFYREILGVRAEVVENGKGRCAHVQVGDRQFFVFRETDAPEKPYDGHHIQIYVADFSGPYRKLKERGLVFQESNQHQYRFKDIVDIDNGKVLFTVDHEVRSQTHPLFGRPLINRNPSQDNQHYHPGHDGLAWGMWS